VTVFGDGRQTRDFIHVKDVARINAAVALNDGATTGSFNVCTGTASTLLDVVRVFEGYYPDAPKPEFQALRRGEVLKSCGDPGKLNRVLGLKAEVSLEEGLRSVIREGA